MSPRALLAGLALAAAVVATNVVIRGDETPPEVGDVRLQPEKVVPLVDGGSAGNRPNGIIYGVVVDPDATRAR